MKSLKYAHLSGENMIPKPINRLKFALILFIFTLIGWISSEARQTALEENFEDQDLSQNPIWTGDLNDFTFIEDSDNILLRLNAEPTPNRSQIRTASATAYGSWEFYVQLPATSSQNRVYFYLISDDNELDIVGSGSPGIANGYAVHTGSGHFDLVKIENGQQTEILLSSNSEIVLESGYQVKVTRNETGLWEIYVGTGYESDVFLDSESIIDQTFTESQYFGIYVRYSSTNIEGYYFDNIIIKGLENPQEGDNGDSDDDGEEDDEESDESGEEGDDEEDEGESDEDENNGNDDENQDDSGDSDEESDDDSGESDDEGDSDSEEAGPVINPGELLISEFYYRVPIHWRTEAYDRPQYVELYNRSVTQLNLRNVKISGENISVDEDLLMESGEYLVITRGLQVFEHRFGLRNFKEADQFPGLNLTTSGTINLENAQGETLEELTYSASEWGGNGVSLERLSFDLNANIRGNWRESMDALTGSPGLPNTVTMPTTSPVAQSISVIAPRTIQVHFSRELDATKSGDLSNYSLDQGITLTSIEFLSGGSLLQFRTAENFQQHSNYMFYYRHIEDIFGNKDENLNELNFIYENPFKIKSVQIVTNHQLRLQFTLPVNISKSGEAIFRLSNGALPVAIQFINSETVLLSYGAEFITGSYELFINQIESFDPDLPEQWIIEPNSSYQFYRFDDYIAGAIVINEFMTRPPNGYPRYIELFNRSDRFLNLKEWQIRRKEGVSNNGGNITDIDLPIGIGEFVVITTDTNQMSTIFGPGPWVEMSGFPSFTQTASDQIRLISPEGQLQEMVEYEPLTWGGNGVSLERRSLTAPISHPGNWGESVANLLGTPGLSNSVGPGQKAPEWVGFEVIDSKTIKVMIDGVIDEKSITPNLFSINGGLSVVQVSTEEPHQIELQLDSPMISTQPYILSAHGITDIFGNVMSEQQRTVIFYQVDKAEPGDVVINEFMYNEPDDYSRYIELYNRSEKIIDLSGWRQANNTGTRRILIEETTLFHPNEYVVLAPNENLLFFFPDLQIINVGSRLSALKNGGDSIIIENNESIVIDSLTYLPIWGDAGISLERKSSDVSAIHRENWAASTAELFGTPGEPNTAKPDSDPPEIIQIKQFENRGFKILLSKHPDPLSVMDLNNYQIIPSVAISGVEINEIEFVLNIDSELINNQTYSITISGITDIFGNIMERTERELLYLKLSDVSEGDVAINEILYRRKEAGSFQFVELINRTDKNFDLSGWSLSNSTGSVILPNDLFFPAMGYLVFTDSGLFASQSENFIQLPGFRSLNNTSDMVKISNQLDVTVDSLRYDSSWQNNPPGVSLERRDPSALSVDPYNWMKSSDPSGSTPGILNSQFEVDDQPPEIIFVNLFHPDSLEVIFNKFIDIINSIEKSGLPLNTMGNLDTEEKPAPTFYINGEVVPILSYDLKKGHRVVIGPGNSDSNEEIILSVDNIGDHSGNIAIELKSAVARPLNPEDLIFNEIMYQPLTDNRNGLPDQSEYIELFNRRPYAISLEGIYLHDEPSNSGNYTVISPVSSAQKWIPSNGYLMLYPEVSNPSFNESRVAKFFNLSEDEKMTTMRFERNSLSLPTTGRKIFIADSTGKTIDWVHYSPDWHNPNLIDNRGIALERVNPDFTTNDPLNWSSSANIEGGTPGKMNSIYQTPEQMVGDHGVFLNPNPFSPDGTGFEDHLFISYKLKEPDYLIRIRIFDRYGRPVRNLVHGEAAGFEGTYIWDGRTDDGQAGRIGIYIILFEAYNSSLGKTLNFKETAVLARKF